jgi:hypothetical protein
MNDRPFDMPQIRPSRLSLFANATIGLLSRLLPPPAEQPRFSWNRGTINELVTVASDLTGVYPDRRFFGIGHGPSFVVHAIGRLGSREKVPVEADHVPFSGSFVEPITGSAHIVRTHCLAHAENFRMVEGKNPSLAAAAQNRSAYEALLTGMGLHPFRIVDDFARTGIRTAFIDVAGKKGIGSLVSFVDFFYEFAGEHDIAPSKIQQAIDIIVLSSAAVPDLLNLRALYAFTAPLRWVPLSPELSRALDGQWSMGQDRFVPHHAPENWGGRPIAVSPQQLLLAERVKEMINSVADDRTEGIDPPRRPSDRPRLVARDGGLRS